MVDGIPIAGLTAPALLLLAVWFILTGRIIPRRTYDDLLRDRDEWRTAHRLSESERINQAKQIDALLEVGITVESIMRSMPHPSNNMPQDGGGSP